MKMLMKSRTVTKLRGFSLIELLIAMALGLIILGSATQFFKSGMDASRLVSQRSEMQDNVRAAINMVAKDVSMAGSGIPPGGLALPYGTGNNGLSVFGKDTNLKTWMNGNTYPTGNFGTPPAAVDNYMYGLIPGPANGMEKGGVAKIPATNQAADAITSIYADFTFPLNQYTAAFNAAGNLITLSIPNPAPVPALPAFINGAGGIQVGDLILLSNSVGSAMGEVTNVTATTITFANLDPLNINQSAINLASGGGNIKYLCNGLANCSTAPAPTAWRIYAVTYFVEVPAIAGQLPKLMRQVDGHPAQPVADDIISLQFTYDVCDSTIIAATCAGISNLFGSGYTPNQVHKVTISVMGQSILSYGNKAQNMQLTTSVATRDLTFKNLYGSTYN